ncbi:TRAP transporter small permease [Devosia sp.]|uniref:TRAP transporter small permease n=1 Tax=Devosia sp. TaxID=1871048 RepID=UPI002EF30052
MTAFLRVLDVVERSVLAVLMLLMVGLYSLAILVRELLPAYARDVAWIDEATRYLLIWAVFLALGAALAQGRQIAMTSYMEKFPERLRGVMRKLIDLTGLAFSLYILWVGLEITWMVVGTGQRSPTLGLSTGYLYLALPAGFALLAFRYALSLFGLIDRWSNSPHEG